MPQTRSANLVLRPARLFILALGVACSGLPASVALAQAPSAPAAAPVPSTKPLTAVFIDVSGKVQWRAKDGDPWQDAKLKDEVAAGVEIRTGLRSRSALRVGQNATVLIDAGTLPAVMQEGSTLRTTCAVKHGRADFKVDEVGMTNDFRVVTPSTTLAVRGTGFGVSSGPLKQVEVVGARTNTINAIELRYALNNTVVQMSGASESSSSVQNPTHSAVVAASAAPPAAASAPATSQAETVQSAAAGPPPSTAGSSAQASSANRATAKAAAATGTGSDTSVVATIQAAVRLANERTAQAIEYLMSLEAQGAAVTAHADAINALQQLAEARKAEADAALAEHEQHLESALSYQSGVDEAGRTFDGADSMLSSHLAAFDAALGRGNGTLDDLRSELDGEDPDRQRLLALAQDAHDALAEMNDAFASVDGARVEMEGAVAAVDAAIAGLDEGARVNAAAAIAAYEAALAALRQAATDGSSSYERALTARAAAVQLEALSRQFANLAATQAALAVGAQALAALAATDLELARAEAGLAAIHAAREAATDDQRAAVLGQIEAIYQQIVDARAALSERLLVATGTVSEADARRAAANASGQELFDRIGDVFGGDAQRGEQDAATARDAALQAHDDASTAAESHAEAIAGAQAIVDDVAARNEQAESIAADVAAGRESIQQSGAQVRATLDAMAQGVQVGAAQGPGARASLLAGSIDVLQSLDALEGTLLALTARVADLGGVLDGAPTSADLDPLQAQAAEAIRVLAASAAAAAAADDGAASGAARAAASSDAASQLQAMVADLAQRFGLSDAMVASAARAAAASAAAAQGAAGEAAAARQLVDVLALLGRSSQMADLAARLGQLSDRNGQLAALAASDLEAARGEVVHANERGAIAFGALAGRVAADASTQQSNVQERLATLQEMAITSTQLVVAMDGVERSAADAERALTSAVEQRIVAQVGEAAAFQALGLTQGAVQSGNLSAAITHATEAGGAAAEARTASGLAVGFANAAGQAAVDAARLHNEAETLRPSVEKFGTNRQAFVDSAVGQRAAVEVANQVMGELRTQSEFYEGVAALLAGRAKTTPAAQAAAGAADARSQVMAIAAQLAGSVADARSMELTATTNAGRLFGRSMRTYVERAQNAAASAAVEANAALLAANRATEHASAAQSAATGGPIDGAVRP
jgi:hypothetical protein